MASALAAFGSWLSPALAPGPGWILASPWPPLLLPFWVPCASAVGLGGLDRSSPHGSGLVLAGLDPLAGQSPLAWLDSGVGLDSAALRPRTGAPPLALWLAGLDGMGWLSASWTCSCWRLDAWLPLWNSFGCGCAGFVTATAPSCWLDWIRLLLALAWSPLLWAPPWPCDGSVDPSPASSAGPLGGPPGWFSCCLALAGPWLPGLWLSSPGLDFSWLGWLCWLLSLELAWNSPPRWVCWPGLDRTGCSSLDGRVSALAWPPPGPFVGRGLTLAGPCIPGPSSGLLFSCWLDGPVAAPFPLPHPCWPSPVRPIWTLRPWPLDRCTPLVVWNARPLDYPGSGPSGGSVAWPGWTSSWCPGLLSLLLSASRLAPGLGLLLLPGSPGAGLIWPLQLSPLALWKCGLASPGGPTPLSLDLRPPWTGLDSYSPFPPAACSLSSGLALPSALLPFWTLSPCLWLGTGLPSWTTGLAQRSGAAGFCSWGPWLDLVLWQDLDSAPGWPSLALASWLDRAAPLCSWWLAGYWLLDAPPWIPPCRCPAGLCLWTLPARAAGSAPPAWPGGLVVCCSACSCCATLSLAVVWSSVWTSGLDWHPCWGLGPPIFAQARLPLVPWLASSLHGPLPVWALWGGPSPGASSWTVPLLVLTWWTLRCWDISFH
ncbi:unnamed protein product [Dicrocoelium dendriticum]|nr:unnamed protein product [Dicrocoelium dendriticum]